MGEQGCAAVGSKGRRKSITAVLFRQVAFAVDGYLAG